MEDHIMATMVTRIVLWFICFCFSQFAEILGLIQQGMAFLIIYLSSLFLITFAKSLIPSFISITKNIDIQLDTTATFFKEFILCTTLLLISWIAAHNFDVDYYSAFQMLTLGRCIILSIDY